MARILYNFDGQNIHEIKGDNPPKHGDKFSKDFIKYTVAKVDHIIKDNTYIATLLKE